MINTSIFKTLRKENKFKPMEGEKGSKSSNWLHQKTVKIEKLSEIKYWLVKINKIHILLIRGIKEKRRQKSAYQLERGQHYISTGMKHLTRNYHEKLWWLDAGRDWGQEEKGTTEDEMAGWHHWLDGRESEWTPGVGDGQGGLACCNSWGHKESDTTEQLNWTDYLKLNANNFDN